MNGAASIEDFRRVVNEGCARGNREFVLRCLLLALDSKVGDQSRLAWEFKVKRATVSKWVRRFVRTLALVPSGGMKRPSAVEVYRRRQLGVWATRRARR